MTTIPSPSERYVVVWDEDQNCPSEMISATELVVQIGQALRHAAVDDTALPAVYWFRPGPPAELTPLRLISEATSTCGPAESVISRWRIADPDGIHHASIAVRSD